MRGSRSYDEDMALGSFGDGPSYVDERENSPYSEMLSNRDGHYGSDDLGSRMTTPGDMDAGVNGTQSNTNTNNNNSVTFASPPLSSVDRVMYGRSPSLRSDGMPTLMTPNSDWPSPGFDLALPIPPIASMTPEIQNTPARGQENETPGVASARETPEPAHNKSPGPSRADVVPAVTRNSIVSQSTESNMFSPSKLRASQAMAQAQAQVRGANVGAVKLGASASVEHLALPKIPKALMDRIATLGPELPSIQKWVLWSGIVLDIIGKSTLVYELCRFAGNQDWVWFSCVLLFFVLSGLMSAGYWLGHYTFQEKLHSDKPEVRIFGFSKTDVKRIIRRFGALCAMLQLGTAFAASRALYTKDVKQRKITMELRGMRLVDTVFLTLSMCSLQVYIGISCSNPGSYCPGRVGFDFVLCVSIFCSLISGTLCFTSLDLMDEWKSNKYHLLEMTLFSLYRLCELSAKILNLTLFAAIYGPWVFLVIALHAATAIGILKWLPTPRKSWFCDSITVASLPGSGRFKVKLPVINDVALLGLCLTWPPSCFISNATQGNGKFWWRSHMAPRKAFSSTDPSDAFIPLPIFNGLAILESVAMLAASYVGLKSWAHRYFEGAMVLVFLWQFFAFTWVSSRQFDPASRYAYSVKDHDDTANQYAADQQHVHVSVIVSPRKDMHAQPQQEMVNRTPMKDIMNTTTAAAGYTTPGAGDGGRRKSINRQSLGQSAQDDLVPPASQRRTSLTSFSLNDDALRESSYFTPYPNKTKSAQERQSQTNMFSP